MAVDPRELIIGHPPDERELALIVDRARRGNAEAFEELVRRVRHRVRDWAARITRDPDDAEDVTQLVLLRVRERLWEFEGQSRFTTWLFRVTRNVALSRRRKESRQSQLRALRGEDLRPRLTEPGTNAVEREEPAWIARMVIAHLDALPPRQREVFELADLAGMSSPQIAARLGIDAATVRVHLLKARRAVRARMLAAHPRLREELE